MKKYLSNPNVKTKTYIVQDFNLITEFSQNLCTNKKLETMINSVNSPVHLGNEALEGYFVNDNVYVYCQNGCLYELQEQKFNRVCDCLNIKPTIVIGVENGKERPLVVLDGKVFYLGEYFEPVMVPAGHSACISHDGRLFIANLHSIYRSGMYDFENSSINLGEFSCINIDKACGEIIEIVCLQKDVIAVCKNAIVKLSFSNQTEVNVEKLSVGNIRVNEQSVALVGENIMFINGSQLYAYDNGNLSLLSSAFEKYNLIQNGKAKAGNGKYYLSVKDKFNQANYIYIYDSVNKKDCVIDGEDLVVCGEECFVNNKGYLCTITTDKPSNLNGKWVSKRLDFNNNSKKTLKSLSIKVNTDALLTISGTFGKRSYSLTKGYNNLPLNLYSDCFVVEITFLDGQFWAQNLQLEYSL